MPQPTELDHVCDSTQNTGQAAAPGKHEENQVLIVCADQSKALALPTQAYNNVCVCVWVWVRELAYVRIIYILLSRSCVQMLQ